MNLFKYLYRLNILPYQEWHRCGSHVMRGSVTMIVLAEAVGRNSPYHRPLYLEGIQGNRNSLQ